MPILGYNRTTTPLPLAGIGKTLNLVASSAGARSGAEDLTNKLRPSNTVDPVNGNPSGLTAAQFAALETQRLTGVVEYHWTMLPEYATAGLTVESAPSLTTQQVTALFLDPGVTGNDNNPGTLARPIKNFSTIPDKLPIDRGDRTRINLAAGIYNEPAPVGDELYWRIGKSFGSKGTPPFVVGPARRDVLGGAKAIDAGSTAKVVNSSVLSTILRSTTTASIIAGASPGQVRLSGITGTYTAADVDEWVRVVGAKTAGNNVRARIAAVGVGTLDIVNAQGVAGDASNGSITVHDALDGALLTIQTGALTGISSTVEENTLADITVQVPFASAPLAAVTYTLTRPNATIVFTADTVLFMMSAGERFIGFKDVKLKWIDGGLGGLVAIGDIGLFTFGCEFQGRLEMRNGAMLTGGQDSFVWAQDGVDNPVAAADDARVATFIHSGPNTRSLQGSFFLGTFSIYHTNFTTQRASAMFLQPHGHRCTFTNSPGSILEMQGTTTGFPSVLDGQLTNNAAAGLVTYQGSTPGFLGISNLVAKNSGGHGIFADRGAKLNVTGTLSGTRNAGVGLRCRDESQVMVPATGMTITGTGGDIQVGQKTARTWTSFNANAPLRNEFDVTGDGARIATAGSISSGLSQLVSGGKQPTVVAGAGAGAAATSLTVLGDDVSGTVTLVTNVADTPSANADIFTLTFAVGYPAGTLPRVVWEPANDVTWDLVYGSWRARQADSTVALTKLRSGTTPLPPLTSATYAWNYHVLTR